MSTLPKRRFTPEEYAALEEKAEYKSPYVAGEISAMAGVQPVHDGIVMNLLAILLQRFRGGPCCLHTADVKVRAKAGTYPGLSIVCGERRYDTSANPRSLLNPQAIYFNPKKSAAGSTGNIANLPTRSNPPASRRNSRWGKSTSVSPFRIVAWTYKINDPMPLRLLDNKS